MATRSTPSLLSIEPVIEDPALPPLEDTTKKKKNWGKQLAERINWGLRNSHGEIGGIGGMAAMFGVPYYHRSPGGDWMTYDPRNQAIYPMGATPPRGGGKAGAAGSGDGSGTDGDTGNGTVNPAELGNLGKAKGFPKWYIDWFNTQGVYGGVPPAQGLL